MDKLHVGGAGLMESQRLVLTSAFCLVAVIALVFSYELAKMLREQIEIEVIREIPFVYLLGMSVWLGVIGCNSGFNVFSALCLLVVIMILGYYILVVNKEELENEKMGSLDL